MQAELEIELRQVKKALARVRREDAFERVSWLDAPESSDRPELIRGRFNTAAERETCTYVQHIEPCSEQESIEIEMRSGSSLSHAAIPEEPLSIAAPQRSTRRAGRPAPRGTPALSVVELQEASGWTRAAQPRKNTTGSKYGLFPPPALRVDQDATLHQAGSDNQTKPAGEVQPVRPQVKSHQQMESAASSSSSKVQQQAVAPLSAEERVRTLEAELREAKQALEREVHARNMKELGFGSPRSQQHTSRQVQARTEKTPVDQRAKEATAVGQLREAADQLRETARSLKAASSEQVASSNQRVEGEGEQLARVERREVAVSGIEQLGGRPPVAAVVVEQLDLFEAEAGASDRAVEIIVAASAVIDPTEATPSRIDSDGVAVAGTAVAVGAEMPTARQTADSTEERPDESEPGSQQSAPPCVCAPRPPVPIEPSVTDTVAMLRREKEMAREWALKGTGAFGDRRFVAQRQWALKEQTPIAEVIRVHGPTGGQCGHCHPTAGPWEQLWRSLMVGCGTGGSARAC